jgi:lipopolysaccharide export system permease protein
MTLIDRYLLRGFFKAWIVCFSSLVSLYVVIDLFNKLDEFVSASEQTGMGLAEVIGGYYAYQLVPIFDRLCGVIMLLAAMFTIAWMQRNNELLPLLSAGVPTRRVLRPVLLGTLVMLGLSVANRELLMPRVADHLENPATDPTGEQAVQVHGAYEPNGILISGQVAKRKERLIINLTCTVPERIGGGLCNIVAREARYIPPGPERLSGGWRLTEIQPKPAPLAASWKDGILEEERDGNYFLRTERVTFDLVTRPQSWYQYASTAEIFQEVQSGGSARLTPLAVHMHLRLMLPALTLVMVWMGLSLILRDQCRNVFLNAGLCLVLAGVFYAACYAARYLGNNEYLAPALAAWLPLLIFGPAALVMFDGIHT